MNSNGAFINPYAKRPAAAARESNDRVNNVAINSVVTDFTMGIQSQLRGGAIKNCKKMATKRKPVYRQYAIGSGVAFVAALHCNQCIGLRLFKVAKARGKTGVSKPHKPHHKKCSLNRKTKGLSAMTVFVENEAARNIARCTAPMASVLGRTLAAEAAEAGTNIGRFFLHTPR